MAHLTKLPTYDIADSNIALLGSDLEKRVREHAGDQEHSWDGAGQDVGLEIWRIQQFKVKPWPKDKYGSFYDGDSYIILNTYKKTPDAESLSYDLHFWLGENTTQDEAGTAAYKTVELDDHLHGAPVQYREVQGYESPHFLSYFDRFICLKGGVATGFHHVTEELPDDVRKLYRISFNKTSIRKGNLIVREVPAEASSLVEGDVYVLDMGSKIFQLNTRESVGQEKFKAAEFVQYLINERKIHPDLTVFDEGSSGAGKFLLEFGEGVSLLPSEEDQNTDTVNAMFKISDESGQATFERVENAIYSSLSSSDAFLVDTPKAVYVWIGNGASLNERRLAPQYAQRYLHEKKAQQESTKVAVPIVKMQEGQESVEFLSVFGVEV